MGKCLGCAAGRRVDTGPALAINEGANPPPPGELQLPLSRGWQQISGSERRLLLDPQSPPPAGHPLAA